MAFERLPIEKLTLRVTKGTTPTTIGGRFASTGINFIKVESITEDGRVDKKKIAFIDTESDELLSRSRLEMDDILFTIAGTIGRVCKVTAEILPANTNQAVAIIRPNKKVVDPDFLAYVLRFGQTQQAVSEGVVQAVQANFSLGSIKSLEIPAPSLATQRMLIKPIKLIDEKINVLRKSNEAIELMARILFRDWFFDFGPTKFRTQAANPEWLTSEASKLFAKSLNSDGVPSGWRLGSLADFASLNPESWSKKTAPDSVRYVDLANTKWGIIDQITCYSWAEAPSRAQRILRPGDTIVGTVRPGNGSYGLVAEDGLTGSTGFAVLRPASSSLREFVYLAATAPENIERLSHLADGGAYPAVRPDVVLATPVPVPPPSIISMFSSIAAPMLNLIESNKSEISTLNDLKSLVLPKILSGQISISTLKDIPEALANE